MYVIYIIHYTQHINKNSSVNSIYNNKNICATLFTRVFRQVDKKENSLN